MGNDRDDSKEFTLEAARSAAYIHLSTKVPACLTYEDERMAGIMLYPKIPACLLFRIIIRQEAGRQTDC